MRNSNARGSRSGATVTAGSSVIIDATFGNRRDREEALKLAERLEADFYIIECICPEDIVRERLDLRMSDTKEASDGRWAIYLKQKETFDRITEIPEGLHIVLDTSLTPDQCTYRALKKMKGFPMEA